MNPEKKESNTLQIGIAAGILGVAAGFFGKLVYDEYVEETQKVKANQVIEGKFTYHL